MSVALDIEKNNKKIILTGHFVRYGASIQKGRGGGILAFMEAINYEKSQRHFHFPKMSRDDYSEKPRKARENIELLGSYSLTT